MKPVIHCWTHACVRPLMQTLTHSFTTREKSLFTDAYWLMLLATLLTLNGSCGGRHIHCCQTPSHQWFYSCFLQMQCGSVWWLASCFTGITETVAQLASGWVTDKNLVHKYHYHKAYLILCGIVNLLSPLATSYIQLMIYAVFFAIFCGGYMALLLPVLVSNVQTIHFVWSDFASALVSRVWMDHNSFL